MLPEPIAQVFCIWTAGFDWQKQLRSRHQGNGARPLAWNACDITGACGNRLVIPLERHLRTRPRADLPGNAPGLPVVR